MARSSREEARPGSPRAVVSSFTIIKGAMLDETYQVFRGWDFALSRVDNLRLMKETNAIGATSAAWLRDVAKVLHRRYDPAGKDRALVELAQGGCSYEVWKPIVLWHITRDELLLRDFLIDRLHPLHAEGALDVRASELHPYLEGLRKRRLVKAAWKASTRDRVASGLLRMAADFGLMKGTLARSFLSYHLPEESFLYVAHAMAETQPNAFELVRSPDWRMYLMDPSDVERELYRLHQFQKLRYEVAGSLAQLTLPCPSAADYARGLVA